MKHTASINIPPALGGALLALIALVAVPAAARTQQDGTAPSSWTFAGLGSENRAEQWRADLAFMASEIPRRHKDAFFSVSEADFREAVSQLHGRIPELEDHAVVVEMARVVALLGDAHTNLSLSRLKPRRCYPVKLYWFSDGIYVVETTEAYEHLIGAQLVRIGAAPVDQALASIATVFPHENESTRKKNAPTYAVMPEVLSALGLVPDMESVTLTFATGPGNESTLRMQPIEYSSETAWLTAHEKAGAVPPISARRDDFYWFKRTADSKLLYVQYNRCRNDPEEPFNGFVEQVLAAIDADESEKLLVDLRYNPGGNNLVAWPLINGLRSRAINREGSLFVAIGRGTFSSAQLNANEFRLLTKAVLVGEPTGQKPNAFGEIRYLTLPASGIRVSYSTKYFKTSKTDEPSMLPDLVVETPSRDYFAGRDPVLDAVLAYRAPDDR